MSGLPFVQVHFFIINYWHLLVHIGNSTRNIIITPEWKIYTIVINSKDIRKYLLRKT